MIRRLSGGWHRVLTRFAIAAGGAPAKALVAQTVDTRVRFRDLSEDEIGRYVATEEGRDKAGAYAIQGIGAFAVEGVEGSCSNVVGLPICEVIIGLRAAGLLGAFPVAGGQTGALRA